MKIKYVSVITLSLIPQPLIKGLVAFLFLAKHPWKSVLHLQIIFILHAVCSNHDIILQEFKSL